jgi:hypothetical protein
MVFIFSHKHRKLLGRNKPRKPRLPDNPSQVLSRGKALQNQKPLQMMMGMKTMMKTMMKIHSRAR